MIAPVESIACIPLHPHDGWKHYPKQQCFLEYDNQKVTKLAQLVFV